MNSTFLYIRFSDAKQEEGSSYSRQIERARVYCREKGLVLLEDDDHIFFDAGKSAYKGEHLAEGGALKRFYDRVSQGKIPSGSRLLVEDFDRLSRQDMWEAADKFRELLRAGIVVVTLMNGREWTGLDGIGDALQMLVKQDLSNQESAKKSDRVGRSWTERYKRARSGLAIKIPLASWLRYGDDGFAILKEPEASSVRLIFEMCINGYGMVTIAKKLTADSHKPFRGAKWITASVSGIIKNSAAMGIYTPRDDGEPVHGYFEPVVDSITWWAAQAAVAGRKKASATRQTKAFNIWQGVARCYYCNSALHCLAKGRNKQQYLVCSGKIAGICKKAKNVRLEESELAFKQMLAQLESLSLIETNHEQISTELSGFEQRLVLERQQYQDFGEAMARRYTVQLDDLAHSTKIAIDQLVAKVEELQSRLSEVRRTESDKKWFLENLDLVTYEKRAQANALVKRLLITASITGGISSTYIVRNGNLKDPAFPHPHPNGRAILQITNTEDGLVVLPLTDDQRARWHSLQPDAKEISRTRDFVSSSVGIRRKTNHESH